MFFTMEEISFPEGISEHTIRLLGNYNLFPFHKHPLWQAVINGKLTRDQVLLAEGQHFLRTRAGQKLRKEAMEKCIGISNKLWEAIIETYLEECTEDDGTPTHLDLIIRFLIEGGFSKDQLLKIRNLPGNIAAIALYKDISDRGVGCHIIGAGMVEFYYSQLSPKIYNAYTEIYKFSEYASETYKIHGTMDQMHAARAFEVVDEAIRIHGWELVEESVRDAFVATSLHYDGMFQACTNKFSYWDGKII
jgi:pyrroloquinoline quinone (PQQ) biosynthesis protein C